VFDTLKVAVFVIMTLLPGYNVLLLIDGRKDVASLEGLGISYILGLGILSMEIFLLGMAGVDFNLWVIILPWAALSVMNAIRHKKGFFRYCSFKAQKYDLVEAGLISLVSLQLLYTFFRAVVRPIESYDSVAIHALKAKILYLAGNIPGSFFQDLAGNFHGAHPDYPLMVSFSEVWMYMISGGFDDFAAKWIFPFFFLFFTFVFHAVLYRIVQKRKAALFLTFFMVSIAQVSAYATIGSADLILGAFFFMGFSYMLFWLGDRSNKAYFMLSLLSAMLLFWIKNEGIMLAAILIPCLFSRLMRKSKKTLREELKPGVILFMLLLCAPILIWMLFVRYNGLVNENFNLSMVNIGRILQNYNKIPQILYEYQKHIFGFKKWNLIWIIMLILAVTGRRFVFSSHVFPASVCILAFFLSYTLVYMMSDVEIGFFLRTTTSRFLLHILPIGFIWVGYMLKPMKITEGM